MSDKSDLKTNIIALNEVKITPQIKIPSASLFDSSFWAFNQEFFYDYTSTFSFSRLYFPNYNLYPFFESDLYNHEDIWSNYVGNQYDTHEHDWQSLLQNHPITLKQFFVQQQIDTPIFLKIRLSPDRVTLKYPSERLVGMLARHGLHQRIWLYYLQVYDQLIREFLFPLSASSSFAEINPTINTLLSTLPKSFISHKESFVSANMFSRDQGKNKRVGVITRFGDEFLDGILYGDFNLLFHKTFYSQLTKYFPIFAMKFKKVDKLKFKHSRGKSGKYTVEWKYIPVYKRLDIVLRWLVDDIMLQKSFRFRNQIWKSIHILLTTPEDSTVKKNRDYVHKHVYARYKNSLLRTLKKL